MGWSGLISHASLPLADLLLVVCKVYLETRDREEELQSYFTSTGCLISTNKSGDENTRLEGYPVEYYQSIPDVKSVTDDQKNGGDLTDSDADGEGGDSSEDDAPENPDEDQDRRADFMED